jgi:hypothetical protein
MYIAEKLRKENIAEYLLYMWQIEDIVRAYGCDLKRIKAEYLVKFGYDAEQMEDVEMWYYDLIRMMNTEGKREKGHLQINNVTLQKLSELHTELTESTKFPFYSSQYYRVLPYIVELRNKGGNKEEPEIETCFNALYGVMMLRLQKKEISPDTQHAVKEITTLVGMLNDYYFKDKEKPLEF